MDNKLSKITMAAVVAAGLSMPTVSAIAADKNMEKCYGVTKSGKNDCGTAKHACAGQSKTDGGKGDWLYVPKGTCDKLVMGSLTKG
jgi:uncharacterized membrane protein